MINLKFFCVLFLILVSTNLFAQKKFNDIVYLKNGSIIHGLVIEVKSNESVKIKTRDENVFVFKMEEVEKIEFGVAKTKAAQYPLSTIDSKPYSGICTGLDVSIGGGIGKNKDRVKNVVSANFLFGYMNKSTYIFGVRAGISMWSSDQNILNSSSTTLDFNISFRLFPYKQKITPLILFDAGFASGDDEFLFGNNGGFGFTYNLGGGIRVNETAKRAFTLAVFYRNQEYKSNNNYLQNNSHPTSIYLDVFCLQAGISF